MLEWSHLYLMFDSFPSIVMQHFDDLYSLLFDQQSFLFTCCNITKSIALLVVNSYFILPCLKTVISLRTIKFRIYFKIYFNYFFIFITFVADTVGQLFKVETFTILDLHLWRIFVKELNEACTRVMLKIVLLKDKLRSAVFTKHLSYSSVIKKKYR